MGSIPNSGTHISKWLGSLTAPTAAMNGSSPGPIGPVVPSSKPGPLAVAMTSALTASWRTITLPYHLFLRWVSWTAALAIHFFSLLGAPPQGYVSQSKLRELNSIIEHMHTREDVYRKTIKEMQDELESKDLDRKRALKKLKLVSGTKAELDALQQQLAELHDQADGGGGGYGGGAASGVASAAAGVGQSGPGACGLTHLDTTVLHVTMAVLLALVLWFYRQECHAIQRKLVFAVLAPVVWAYASMVLSKRPTGHPLLLYSAAWGLIGFIGAYKFSDDMP